MKLSAKYSPGIDAAREIDRFLNVVAIIEITIDKISGKEAKELMMQRDHAI